MKTTIDTYPVFDANQVLTDDHLNAVVRYLDEQERLTRANLVGIGISCGLDLAVDSSGGKAGIAKGCAVTSLGYLLIEHDNVTLTGYREYELPAGDAYAPFMDGNDQIPLWESFPAGEPKVTPLDTPADFLKDKSVLLFLERSEEDLADCSPSNCDDKGAEVTVTLRRLLVKSSDVAQITERLRTEAGDSARLELSDLRLHRYDVPSTTPVTTRDVLAAFQSVLKKDSLVTAVKEALDAAYAAFKPILLREHPANPFDGFMSLHGFLESLPQEARQVTFMQYYMDLFSDLLAAYEEFRKRGLEYACLCCPPEDWFPRHVILGPEERTRWYPSSASRCGCEPLRQEVVLLFTRLVEISRRFTNNPPLRESSLTAVDEQIRITPSKAGAAPLSARCIPYYYEFTVSRPLYRVWNPALTAQGRAHHNQAYRSNEYSPPGPPFVSAPLTFDLEPFDFLRIEGHLGKDYRAVLARLQGLRDAFRLPFEIVAVRTGELDESLEVDPAEHACRFQDLEAAYDVLREELMCLAKKAITVLGRFQLKQPFVRATEGGTPVPRRASRPASTRATRAAQASSVYIPLAGVTTWLGKGLADVAKEFNFGPQTIGAVLLESIRDFGFGGLSIVSESSLVNAALAVLNKLAYLTSLLAEDLHSVVWDDFEKLVQQLKKHSESIGHTGSQDVTEDGLSWQELNRQIVSVVFACRLEGLLAIRDEYLIRLRQIRRLAYFSGYVREHPAIQHKAGVPIGGTFVIVYHEDAGNEEAKDGIYGSAIERLAPGTVIADFCLPYQCRSDCAPVQFVIGSSEAPPLVAPTLTARVECTDPETGARVEITASGGKPRYQLSVGEAEVGVPFPETLFVALKPGTHTLLVTDAEDVVGAPITLQIRDTLTTEAVKYVDDRAAGTFTASFKVKGGQPPYKAHPGMVEGDVVTVGMLKSGTTLKVEIKDEADCSTEVAIQHAVEPGCDKPCNGKATRSRYPAWAPRPAKSTSYQYKALTTWKLIVTDESGRPMFSEDLATDVLAIITRETAITEATYAGVMSSICREVSKLVDAKLAEKYGERAFVIEYDAKAGTLLIEAYSCHTFLIEVDFTLSGAHVVRTEHWSYTRDGIRVEQRATSAGTKSYAMPAFGRVEMDKCTNQEVKDCAVDLRGIAPEISGNSMVLKPTFEGVVGGLEFHWRVDSPSLMYSNRPEVRLPRDNATTVQIQLLVIDKDRRCWAFAETSIPPGPITPIRFARKRK